MTKRKSYVKGARYIKTALSALEKDELLVAGYNGHGFQYLGIVKCTEQYKPAPTRMRIWGYVYLTKKASYSDIYLSMLDTLKGELKYNHGLTADERARYSSHIQKLRESYQSWKAIEAFYRQKRLSCAFENEEED